MTEHTQCGFYLVGWIFHLRIAVLGLCSGTQLILLEQFDPVMLAFELFEDRTKVVFSLGMIYPLYKGSALVSTLILSPLYCEIFQLWLWKQMPPEIYCMTRLISRI